MLQSKQGRYWSVSARPDGSVGISVDGEVIGTFLPYEARRLRDHLDVALDQVAIRQKEEEVR